MRIKFEIIQEHEVQPLPAHATYSASFREYDVTKALKRIKDVFKAAGYEVPASEYPTRTYDVSKLDPTMVAKLLAVAMGVPVNDALEDTVTTKCKCGGKQ